MSLPSIVKDVDGKPIEDDRSIAFLKLLGNPLSKILTVIINRLMNCGYVPYPMKVVKHTPVHKGGEFIQGGPKVVTQTFGLIAQRFVVH